MRTDKKWPLIVSDTTSEKKHWEVIRGVYAYILSYPCTKAEAKSEAARLKSVLSAHSSSTLGVEGETANSDSLEPASFGEMSDLRIESSEDSG